MGDENADKVREKVTWRDLENLGEAFRDSDSEEAQRALVSAWQRYLQAVWPDEQVGLEELAFTWKDLRRNIEFRDQVGATPPGYRFIDAEHARALQQRLKYGIFSSYVSGRNIAVRNAELCFLGYDAMFERLRREGGLVPGMTDMILANRLMLALERFTLKMTVSGEWQDSVGSPNDREVVVDRVSDFLDEHF